MEGDFVEPFKVLHPQTPSSLQRLLSRQPRENAFVEINNLLAQAKRVQDLYTAVSEDRRESADAPNCLG